MAAKILPGDQQPGEVQQQGDGHGQTEDLPEDCLSWPALTSARSTREAPQTTYCTNFAVAETQIQ